MKRMKSLVQHINEKRHINETNVILAHYIFDLLEKYVNTPAENPTFKNESWLYEQYSEYEEYDILINFKDIEGFDWMKNQLLQYSLMNDAEFDCDMVVRLEKMNKDNFGYMAIDEPMLSINAKYYKTPNIFKNNENAIRNTIMHEITHYVQYMGGILKIGRKLQRPSVKYDKEFYENVRQLGSENYSLMSFVLYSFPENERYARVSGLYGTLEAEFNKLFKQYKKQYKQEPTTDEFINFVLHNDKYNDNEIHFGHYTNFIKSLENDTYETYKKCVDDESTIYRDDSMVYVFLNFCDHCNPRPWYLLPNKNICIANTRTEERYDEVKTKVIEMFKKNFDKYMKNMSDVVGDFYDEMTK